MKTTEALYIDTDQSMSFNIYNKKRKSFWSFLGLILMRTVLTHV